MSPKFTPPRWIWIVLAISTLASLYVGLQRLRLENSNKAVHFVADMPDIKQLAAVSGLPIRDVLLKLKQSGLTGVAVAEDTFDDLLVSGRLVAIGGGPRGQSIYVCPNPQLALRIQKVIESRFGPAPAFAPAIIESDKTTFSLPGRVSDIKGFGLGLDRESANLVRSARLSVIARVGNPPVSTRASISNVVSDARSAGAEGVIVSGDQVLGRRDLVPFAADELKRRGLWFGVVEFANQGGLQRMLKEMLHNSLRVHSMLGAEIDRNELPDIIDRYVRAVAERNIKVCFLRPITWASDNPLDSFSELISTINRGINRAGYEAKKARPMEDPSRPVVLLLIAGMGIAVVGTWLVGRLLPGGWEALALLLFVILVLGLIGGYTTKYLSLLGALVFPTWAMLAALSLDNAGGDKAKWIRAFFWITAISVVGGLHVSALMTELPYMMRLEQFFGVKAAHFIPPLIVAGYLLFDQFRMRDVLDAGVRWADFALFAAVCVAMLFMLMRTGNDAPGDVSSVELKVRTLLDHILPERPRTKEFLVGHPALVVALAMAFRGDRKYLPLAGLLAAVGQASVLNTFCHLHTPISVSVMRVITGMVVGGIIGLGALWIYNRIRRLPEPLTQ